MITETYYKGRNGIITIVPKRGKRGETLRIYTVAELQAITRLYLHYGGGWYDSTTTAGLFDWSTKAVDGEIDINLQLISDSLVVGDDLVEVVAIAPDYPDGIVIGQFKLIVSSEAEPPEA